MGSYEIMTLITAVIGVLLIAGELALGVWALRAEHERQKKQATIEYLLNIRPLYKQLWNDVQNRFGYDIITETMVKALENEHEIRREIKELLATLEHASVGMNTGVYDKDLWYRMSASFLIRLYNRLRTYIKYVQSHNPNAYIEFEGIVQEFEERKRKAYVEEKGNIKYS